MKKQLPRLVAGVVVLGLIVAVVYVVWLKPPAPVEKKNGIVQDKDKDKDPTLIVPPVYQAPPVSLAAATEFLYQGDKPRQVGVKPGTIAAKRAAVLRGNS